METSPVQSPPVLEVGTWRCMACTKPTNTIQVLPCQHKFCAPCLKLWAMIYIDMYNGRHDNFPCQVCWKRFAVPAQGLEAFEQDFQVRLLQENMAQMTMGRAQNAAHNLYQGRSVPFSYTPPPHSEESPNKLQDEMSDYMQQPYDVPKPGVISPDMTEQCTQVDETMTCDPGTMHPGTMHPGTVHTSMVSHMVPQPLTGTQECREDRRSHPGPGYCMRSHHMYMHMI